MTDCCIVRSPSFIVRMWCFTCT